MTSDIVPKSMEGIKRLAKKIKKEQGIAHMHALNEAAKRAGYSNFQHAKNVLEKEKQT